MSLNGSVPVTLAMPTVSIGSAVANATAAVKTNVASVQLSTVGNTTASAAVFSAGSKVTLANLVAPFNVLNGLQTLLITNGPGAGSGMNFNFINPDIAGGNTVGTAVGLPAVTPIFSFGNDTQAAPVIATAIVIDYFSLIWNPGVGGGTGTPTATKPRYW
jgi:hypothetical protein